MKKTMIMLAIALCAVAASAENNNRVEMGETFNKEKQAEYVTKLLESPKDVLVFSSYERDGYVCTPTMLFDGESVRIRTERAKIVVETVSVPNEEQTKAFHEASVRSLVEDNARAEGSQDYVTLYSPELDETIVTKRVAKYGWKAFGGVGYEIGGETSSPTGTIGIGYDRKFWGINVYGRIGKSKTSSVAEIPEENYTNFSFGADLLVLPVKLDCYDQNRLSFIVGGGFSRMITNSREIDENGTRIQSEGYDPFWKVGIGFEHRPFAKQWGWYVQAYYENRHGVSTDFKENQSWFGVTAGINFNFLRIPAKNL